MKKILITGSNGQLGNELQQLMAQYPDYEAIWTDVAELDITCYQDVDALLKKEQPDFIINAAAYTAVDQAEDDEETAENINYIGVMNLARLAKTYQAFLIHISTDYVFSGQHYRPYTENSATAPTGVYGQTKRAGEEAIQKINYRSAIFRTAWLYSAFGKNFVKTMYRLTRERDSLQVVADQIGSPTWAGDLARALLNSLPRLTHADCQVYHYANEGVASWYDFTRAIADMAGHTCDIQAIRSEDYPAKAPRPHYSVLDKSKVKRELQVAVPYWRDSLAKVMKQLAE